MLSESSYLTAIYTYTGAACALILYLGWWLRRHWSWGWVALVVLLLAALMLTPAHPNADVPTFAPAFIVAVFEALTHGPEAAQHAIKPLAVMTGVALGLSVLLGLILFWRRRAAKSSGDDATRVAESDA